MLQRNALWPTQRRKRWRHNQEKSRTKAEYSDDAAINIIDAGNCERQCVNSWIEIRYSKVGKRIQEVRKATSKICQSIKGQSKYKESREI